MKNQYFGDINDYKKYGLIRSIIRATGFRVLIAWMLTPDDGSSDGKFTSYLQKAREYAHHDKVLFGGLSTLLIQYQHRHVGLIEGTDLLPGATYFSDLTPDQRTYRKLWFRLLSENATDVDLIFLDPDNGLEVKSKAYGSKRSSKYLYWREIEELWTSGKSLLIYQHFIREKREKFIQRMLKALRGATPGSTVQAFSTANVVFLMALQPEHRQWHAPIMNTVRENWEGRIRHWDLIGK